MIWEVEELGDRRTLQRTDQQEKLHYSPVMRRHCEPLVDLRISLSSAPLDEWKRRNAMSTGLIITRGGWTVARLLVVYALIGPSA